MDSNHRNSRELRRAWEDWGGSEAEDLSTPEPHQLVAHGSVRAETPTEALMRCAPGDVPETSVEELEPLRAILDAAEATLSEEDLWVYHALFTRKLSERQMVRETEALFESGQFSKPWPRRTVRRRRDLMLAKLRGILETDPAVLDYLFRGTWND
jgi:hypothetical protein